MKRFVSIVALLVGITAGAQNWVFQPGTGYLGFPVHRFWNDTLGNRLLGVGSFDSIGGIYAPGFAQWNGTIWSATGTETIPGAPSTFSSVTSYNNDIILAGNIPAWNGNDNYVLRWTGASFDSLGRFALSGAQSMLQWQNTLVVGIAMNNDTISGVPFNTIAGWDGSTWFDMGQGVIQGAVQSMVVFRDTLYVGAYSASDQFPYVFRYVNGTWETVGPRFYGAIYSLCVYDDALYAGSYNSGSGPGKAISQYDPTTNQWLAPGGGIFSSWGFSEVESMAVMEGRLYAMGDFDYAGGVPADHIAAWDGTEWCGLGNATTWAMRQIVAYDSSIYISTGNLFDGSQSTQFVEWVGDNYSDTCGIFNGIKDQQHNAFVSIYPNPAGDNVTFAFSNSAQRTISLYDQIGREVTRMVSAEETISFDLTSFAAGLYFYTVTDESTHSTSGKLLIQH